MMSLEPSCRNNLLVNSAVALINDLVSGWVDKNGFWKTDPIGILRAILFVMALAMANWALVFQRPCTRQALATKPILNCNDASKKTLFNDISDLQPERRDDYWIRVLVIAITTQNTKGEKGDERFKCKCPRIRGHHMVPPERIRHLRGHHPLNDRADEEINKLHHSTVNDHAQFIYSTFHSRDSICAIDDCFKDFHDEGGIHWNGVRGVYRCHLTSLSSLRGFCATKGTEQETNPWRSNKTRKTR